MSAIRVDRLDSMNLLGLFVRDLMERNLARPPAAARARRLRGRVALKAGRMAVTLCFHNGEVALERGADERANAAVEGSLAAFLRLGLGQNPLRAVLTRQVKVRGNLWLLAQTMGLLRRGKEGN